MLLSAFHSHQELPQPFVSQNPFSPSLLRPKFGNYSLVGAFQDVFDRHELNKYGNEKDLKERYKLLPKTLKAVVDPILKNKRVSHDEVAEYYKEGRLGLLEECADVLFEYQMYRAAVDGMVGEGQLFSWVDELKALKAEGKPFLAMKNFVKKAIRPEQYQRFQEINGFSDKALSDELFSVSCLKPAQWAMKGKHDVLVANAREHFVSEAKELVDELEDRPFLQVFMRAYLKVMVPLEPLLGEMLSWVPRQIVRHALGVKTLRREDLARYVIFKQTGRQDLDYSSELKYDQRKMVLKPFEVLVEASILKQLERESGLLSS